VDRDQWDERYGGGELVWTSTANEFLVSEVADLPAGRAVDLACGEGRNAVWLAERGWKVTGVDFSPVGLAKAQRLAEARQVVGSSQPSRSGQPRRTGSIS
jgi:2-polyprenyl-3-methyl-5-hydroxy-6-metoxy-1,4-benzoquinol methylase